MVAIVPTQTVTTQTVTTHKDEIDTSDVARLVRLAAEGDRRAWEGLVDQYSRLIWAITRGFKLVESDAADVAQATWLRLLEHIDRIEYPDRVGSWLAATARNECLRSLAARKKVVLADDSVTLEGVAAHEPDVDEAPAGRRTCPGGPRGPVPPALEVAADARDADGGSAGLVRGDIGPAGTAGRQYRPDPSAMPGQAP